MSDRAELFPQFSPRPEQADAVSAGGAVEDPRCISRVEAIPRDEAQDLPITLAQPRESRVERGALSDEVGRISVSGQAMSIVRDALVEPAASLRRATMVGQHPIRNRIEPRQHRVWDAVAPAPSDGEGLGDDVLRRRAALDSSNRKGEHIGVVGSEAALEPRAKYVRGLVGPIGG
jgi:hypothetical protein